MSTEHLPIDPRTMLRSHSRRLTLVPEGVGVVVNDQFAMKINRVEDKRILVIVAASDTVRVVRERQLEQRPYDDKAKRAATGEISARALTLDRRDSNMYVDGQYKISYVGNNQGRADVIIRSTDHIQFEAIPREFNIRDVLRERAGQ